MKLNLTLVLIGTLLLLPRLHAADLPAPLPEFMDKTQMAKWVEEKEATATQTTPAAATETPTTFYTGKPYLAVAGGYIYKYRTYNPESAHWTSTDPSGYPDGANNQVYAPIATSQLDNSGLMTVNGSTYASGNTYSNEFPGTFNYASYTSTSSATASNSTGAVNLSAFISGFTTFSTVHDMSKNPVIDVSMISGTSNLTYNVVGSCGGADGVVGEGISFTVTGDGTSTLIIHAYSAFALSATNVSGVGVSLTGGSISFTNASEADGPAGIGTFTFKE